MLLALVPAARADIVLTIYESGSDLVLSAEGSVDLDGLTFSHDNGGTHGLWLGQSNAYGLFQGATDVYISPNSLVSSGGWPSTGQISVPGGGLSMQNAALLLPDGYVSGEDITNLFTPVTKLGASFASLGLVDGLSASISWTASSGDQTVSIVTDQDFAPGGAAAPSVSEPGIPWLIGLGLTGLAFRRRRKD